LIAWRICKRKYSRHESILSGEGAKEFGGRWNEPGLPLVYASESSSLSLLEQMVHAPLERLPKSLVAVRIEVPDDASVTRVDANSLPPDWREVGNTFCIALGSDWIRSAAGLVLIVPSAVNPLERNILLNPVHPDIARCSLGDLVDVEHDRRLIAFFDQ
jgi:RES domain-containing protein